MSKKRSLNFIKCLIMFITIWCSSENKNPKEKELRNLEIILGSKSFRRIDGETASSSTFPTVGTTSTAGTTTPNITINTFAKANSNGGLSTGGIVAIVIPSIAVLVGVGIFATLFKSTPPPDSVPLQSLPPAKYINASLEQLSASNPEVVVQQPGLIKELPVQPFPQQMAVVKDVVLQPTQVVDQVPVIEQAQVQQIVPVQ